MKITLENALTLVEGEIDLEPGVAALLFGPNMKGKTSAITMIGGVLARDINPAELPASATQEYLRDGQDSGFVAIDGDEVVWNLKSSDIALGANVRSPITRAAAGLIDFMAIAGKERAKVYERLFLPPETVLIKSLRKALSAHLDEREIDGVIDVVKANGWDGVDEVYAKRGRIAKRNWQAITGSNYGVKVAVDWLPDDWLPAYDGLSVADCDKAIEEGRIVLKGLEVAQTISQSDIERGQQAADLVPKLEAELKASEEPLASAREELRSAQSGYDGIRERGRGVKAERDAMDRQKPRKDQTVPCPYCDGALVVQPSGNVAKHDASGFEEAMAEWQDAYDKISADLELEAAKLKAAEMRKTTADTRVNTILADQEPIKNRLAMAKRDAALVDREVAEEDNEAVAEATAATCRLNDQRNAVERRVNAHKEHDSVVSYTHIANLLGSKGVRAQAMKKMMDALDRFLGVVADQTGWPRVKLALDYSVKIGRRSSTRLCSESEKWRAQVSIQVAIARMKRDVAIVIDRSELLDDRGRDELRTLVGFLFSREEPPALLIAATWTREDVPEWVVDLGDDVRVYRLTDECRIEEDAS